MIDQKKLPIIHNKIYEKNVTHFIVEIELKITSRSLIPSDEKNVVLLLLNPCEEIHAEIQK